LQEVLSENRKTKSLLSPSARNSLGFLAVVFEATVLINKDQPPAVEEARLAAVRRYDILDSPPDGAFDRIAALAAAMFDVPIALVTIVDENRIWFKSLYGLDGPHEIPREPGLCGSAIYQDDPYVVTEARSDPRTVSNLLVAGQFGLQFYAAAPLITAGGHRLGTLCIMDRKSRTFSQHQAGMLKALAGIVVDEMELRLAALRSMNGERVARDNAAAQSKVKAGLFDREHQIATLLQSAMMPRTLPQIAGLKMSGSYVAASVSGLVGGDWYDAFQTANERVLITVGDVMGHGLDAAVSMGKVRQALRVLARNGMTPVGILNNLDVALHEEDMELSVTVFVGLLDPRSGLLEYSSAGHPPPLMRTAAGGVSELEFGDPPLGIFPNNDRNEHHLKLDIGSMLVLYTDGLTESTRNIIEGERLLRAVLQTSELAISEEAAESLRQRLTSSTSDDVAILTVTRTQMPLRPRARLEVQLPRQTSPRPGADRPKFSLG
jgi:sigma-B regulation protein RsbU (phosphoserine phosphatase)